jgi:hypothetical protein
MAITGCGCDLVGCVDGLLVGFSRTPQTPWTVELLGDGVLLKATSAELCPAQGPCQTGVRFNTTAARAVVRVTTPLGVRDTELGDIEYAKTSRGTGCAECRGQAQVVVEVP